MARLPTEHQASFSSLLQAKGQSIDAGVVAATHTERLRYWHHWERFVAPFRGVGPMLTNTTTNERIELLTSFAEHVRSGACGQGNQVRTGTVQVAICAIGKTFELDGLQNPVYRTEGRYWLPLERQLEGFRRHDPPAQHKLAVPISLVEHIVNLGTSSPSNKVRAICDMCTIAFYYLLRVGEYTSHRRQDRRRTQQFRVCDITFYDAAHTIIPNTADLSTLTNALRATMRITNQKNGTRGSIISHDKSNTTACPVQALARRVHHILSQPTSSPNDIISTYYSPQTKGLRCLQSGNINKMLKAAVVATGLDRKGFPPSSISSHSLRAGGAMAMHLNGIPRNTIQKQGRWSSDTFLMYSHEQIAAFSAGLSAKMSQNIGWFNIAGPQVLPPN